MSVGLNLGILGSEHDNSPKLLHGSVKAAFMGINSRIYWELECRTYEGTVCFKVVNRFVSKIMAKKAILTSHRAQFEHPGS